jgi:hypothetical protein
MGEKDKTRPHLQGDHAGGARQLDILQRTESEFDPIPFDPKPPALYGVLTVVPSPGPQPRTTGSTFPPHHLRTMHRGTARSATVTNGAAPVGKFGSERIADQPRRREGPCDSQAQSASSILVTRSTTNPQVNDLGVVCCLVQFEGRAPLVHHIWRSIGATTRVS